MTTRDPETIDWVKAGIPGGLAVLAFTIAFGLLWRMANWGGATVATAIAFAFGALCFFLWVTSDRRLSAARAELQSLFVPGESVLASAVQRRLFALTHRRLLVVATSGRLICMRRRLIAGFQIVAARWQDLKEVNVDAGVFGATIVVTFLTSPDLPSDRPDQSNGPGTERGTFAGLRKTEAHEVYRICQAQDQAWREKRRVRDLEELRAKSGGIQFAAQTPQMGALPGALESEDPVVRLERAKAMLEKGLISDAEFESLKARIVNAL